MLKRIGFEVVTACDGSEAIELYQARKGEIALVLLDVTMPHMNGEMTLRELHKIDPSVRVLMSSGYAGTDRAARFEGKGLAGFVQKPYSLDDLHRRLRAALSSDAEG
jgi:DNA-binding NtrC family response regulator